MIDIAPRIMEVNGKLVEENVNIFEFEGRGLWGPIKGLVALGPDLKTLESITIIAQEETPGLGGRISETKFLDQFRKKKLKFEDILSQMG